MNIEKIKKEIYEKYRMNIVSYEIVPRLMFRENMVFIDSNTKKYIVKKYPVNTKDTYLNNLSQLYQELCQNGIDTNRIVLQESGNSFFELEDGKYVVFSYVKGNRCKKENITIQLSKTMKELHGKLEYIKADIVMEKTWNQIQECYENVDAWTAVDDLTGQIVQLKDYYKEILQNYAPNKQMVIHGDCTINNIIMNNYEYGFIDFDNYKLGDPLEDLANLSNSILYDRETGDITEQKDIIKELISGYGLSQIEYQNLKLYMQLNCLIELQKHQKNYRFLKRNPGTYQYLSKLVSIINVVKSSL